ncbi:hypothetical protein L873DRAFT_1734372 [Choiromyces venosus 120613-1]|uniref:Uncharacterized protein n=1 Tax=Choiromyces venosus 120613-1 TaxID=1336337 RepID=A0A3N4JT31_9PEZI|nr:hypothetical protein L873DRAFT_1734367 [Choiromyces venosus 120613-1]RPB01493.1 hypothetical protein L873DRAFT_1734372 [Choiromyces venosus 120613-1]
MSHNKADTKKGKRKATTEDSRVGIQEANLISRFNAMFKFCYYIKANELLMAG